MYSDHELMCTLKGSLIRINFLGDCLGDRAKFADCVYHLRVVGEQILDHDLRRSCTEEETDVPLPFNPKPIVIAILAVILVMIIIAIAVKRIR